MFKLSMAVDLCLMDAMFMLVLMNLTLMQGHSGSATKQTISIKLATTVGHFLRDHDLGHLRAYKFKPHTS